jgi:hypothetical protein
MPWHARTEQLTADPRYPCVMCQLLERPADEPPDGRDRLHRMDTEPDTANYFWGDRSFPFLFRKVLILSAPLTKRYRKFGSFFVCPSRRKTRRRVGIRRFPQG